MQVLIAFCLGVIFSPFSYGFALFIFYLVVYELLYAIFTGVCYPYWAPLFRLAVVAASIYGWIIGRTVAGWTNIFQADPNAA
jgi:hypothetical protein